VRTKFTGAMSGLAAVVCIVMASEMAEDCLEDTEHFPWIPTWLKPFVWLLLVHLASIEGSKAREALVGGGGR